MRTADRFLGTVFASLVMGTAIVPSAAASPPSHPSYCHSYYYGYDQCEHGAGGGWGGHQEHGPEKRGQRRHGE